jgi:hypothetical protein
MQRSALEKTSDDSFQKAQGAPSVAYLQAISRLLKKVHEELDFCFVLKC